MFHSYATIGMPIVRVFFHSGNWTDSFRAHVDGTSQQPVCQVLTISRFQEGNKSFQIHHIRDFTAEIDSWSLLPRSTKSW